MIRRKFSIFNIKKKKERELLELIIKFSKDAGNQDEKLLPKYQCVLHINNLKRKLSQQLHLQYIQMLL